MWTPAGWVRAAAVFLLLLLLLLSLPLLLLFCRGAKHWQAGRFRPRAAERCPW